jgi:hypothetical protein
MYICATASHAMTPWRSSCTATLAASLATASSETMAALWRILRKAAMATSFATACQAVMACILPMATLVASSIAS